MADFSARNFERLESFEDIALKTGKELVVTAKDAYMLQSLACVDGVCRTESVRIYDEIIDKGKRKWESVQVRKHCGDQYVSHNSIRDNPDNYLLCFSFFDMKHLLDVKPTGGTYIYSACEAFTEEMEIDFRRLWQWLRRFNITPCGFSMKKSKEGDDEIIFDKQYHDSGHASGEDITWVIEQIDPDCIVPIHTEARDWFDKNFENAKLVNEGQKYVF